jgi:hypothetical protein
VSSHQDEDFLFDFKNGNDCILVSARDHGRNADTRTADIIGLY